MKLLAAIFALLALAPLALAQSSITLRPSAAIIQGQPILLGDIAALEGPEAESLASLVILPAGAGPTPASPTITIDDLRRSLNQARVNWSRLTLRGGTCAIRSAEPAPAPPVTPEHPAEAAAPADDGSVRAAVAARIGQILQAEPEDLRLAFNPADDDILNLPIAGRTLEIKPTGASDRLPLALTLYHHDRIVASKTIRIAVQVRREVVIASAAKRRGDTIGEGDVTFDHQWLGPAATPASRGQVIGAAVRSRLNPGEVITEAQLSPPVVVRKGDQVTVRVVAGTVVISTRARAMAAARDGEIVELQAIDGSNRTFSARMDGRGRAVLVAAQHNGRTR